MNEVQWEYILLHSLPKEWVPMTEEQATEGNSPETEDKSEREGNKEGEEVIGTSTGSKATDTKSDSDGTKEDTHSTGQGSDPQSGGRVPVGSSGNSPGKPDVISTGDFGKDSSGSWRTRKTERKSLPFQKRIRERKAAQGQKG